MSDKSFNDALAALNNKDLTRAEELFKRAIEIDESSVPALNLLVVVLMSMERFAEAEPYIARATSLDQRSDVSFYNYGLISKRLNKPQQALENFSKALSLNARVAETWNNRGTVFNDLEKYDLAIADFDKAISLNSLYSEAYVNKAKSLLRLLRYDEAFAAYGKALSIRPDLLEAWLGCGNVLAYLARYDEAFAAYDKALLIKPDLVEAWLGRGNVLASLKRPDEAFAAYDKALSIMPDLAEAWLGRGNVLASLKRHDEAFTAYDKARSIKPDLQGLEGSRLHAKMHLCNWENLDADISDLIRSTRAGKPNCAPFMLLSLTDSPDDHLRCSKAWEAATLPRTPKTASRKSNPKHDKIRVGYVSPDFGQHPVGHLAAGLFETHSKDRFETYAFSLGPDDGSSLRRRLEGSFVSFMDCCNKSDQDIITMIERTEIDILVDMAGHTQGARPSLFVCRSAPIQVNYLGYPGTTGAESMDYIVGDYIAFKDADAENYSEKLIFLPHSFVPYDIHERVPDRSFKREQFGLPDDAFVFCCLNRNNKILPDIFDSWMQILKHTGDGSVIWLSASNQTAKENLRREAAGRSVDPARLVFADIVPLSDHMARQQLADIFLDTLPHNAITTASDALWAGLPVLTLMGQSFAARGAASVLNALDLSELITHSREEYESRAIELALNRDRLNAIKAKLASNRTTKPMFDLSLYTKHLEAAYDAIYLRYTGGLPPDHIRVDA